MEKSGAGVESHLYLGLSSRRCCIVLGHVFKSTAINVKGVMISLETKNAIIDSVLLLHVIS